jgi:hypothetical protein
MLQPLFAQLAFPTEPETTAPSLIRQGLALALWHSRPSVSHSSRQSSSGEGVACISTKPCASHPSHCAFCTAHPLPPHVHIHYPEHRSTHTPSSTTPYSAASRHTAPDLREDHQLDARPCMFHRVQFIPKPHLSQPALTGLKPRHMN